MAVLSGLEPKTVFDYFERLCAVPHGSGNTKQISDLCVGFAEALGLRYRQDAVNNLIIWKDASPGMGAAEPVILQGHMDMVCAKAPDCTKDMAKEGLDLATDGEWVWAEKTSLGGDNCIAVAMILAILADSSLVHPPLEAVFTVDEEVGMDGAFALDCSDLKGRQLVNIDSEDEGIFTVSCAGGVRTDCYLPAQKKPLTGETCCKIVLSGLRGGHSGVDIDKGRCSANRLMARVLYSACENIPGLRLSALAGGEFDNVICPHCEAVAAVPAAEKEKLFTFVESFAVSLQNEYAGCGEKGLSLTCEAADADAALSAAATMQALRLLMVLPQGVQEMSYDFPGLVQTSVNQGVLRLEEDGLHVTASIRSCIASQKAMVLQQVQAAAALAGAKVSAHSDYPGWQFARESALRERMLAAYRVLSGKEGEVEAIHAGLECGLFVEKLPGLDAISLGPDLRDVHSINERLNVASTARVYELVRRFLQDSAAAR